MATDPLPIAELQDLSAWANVDAVFLDTRHLVAIVVYRRAIVIEELMTYLIESIPAPVQVLSLERINKSLKALWDEQFPEAILVA